MNKLEQAARQALEALLDSDDGGGLRYTEVQAVAALREALAEQAEQEPIENNDWKKASYIRETLNAEQAEQEPVGKIVLGQYEVPYIDWTSGVKVEDGMKIYAATVRTKDLTDDEILKCDERSHGNTEWTKKKAFARAVIAADREKNK